MAEKNWCKFLEHLKEQHKADSTLKTYTTSLEEFKNYLGETGGDLENITSVDVNGFVKYLQDKGLKPATINQRYFAIRAYLKFIGKGQLTARVPRLPNALEIAPKSLSANETKRILREVEKTGNRRDIAIINMLLYTGLRISELCNLNRTDVTMSERGGMVIVRFGKGMVSRKVPLSVIPRNHLIAYLNERTDKRPELFTSQHRKRITPNNIRAKLRKFGIHPHLLRHTFAHGLVQNGADIGAVADLMGHKTINMTRRYAKPTFEELQKTIEKVFG